MVHTSFHRVLLRVDQSLRVEASFSCLYGWGSGLAFRTSEWGLVVWGFRVKDLGLSHRGLHCLSGKSSASKLYTEGRRMITMTRSAATITAAMSTTITVVAITAIIMSYTIHFFVTVIFNTMSSSSSSNVVIIVRADDQYGHHIHWRGKSIAGTLVSGFTIQCC